MSSIVQDANSYLLYLNDYLLKKDANIAQYIAYNYIYAYQNYQLQYSVIELYKQNQQLYNTQYDLMNKINAMQSAAQQKFIYASDFYRRVEIYNEDYQKLYNEYTLLAGKYDIIRTKGQMLLSERNRAISDFQEMEAQFRRQQAQIIYFERESRENAKHVEENRQLIYAQSSQIIYLNQELIAKQRELEVLKCQNRMAPTDCERLREENTRLVEAGYDMMRQLALVKAKAEKSKVAGDYQNHRASEEVSVQQYELPPRASYSGAGTPKSVRRQNYSSAEAPPETAKRAPKGAKEKMQAPAKANYLKTDATDAQPSLSNVGNEVYQTPEAPAGSAKSENSPENDVHDEQFDIANVDLNKLFGRSEDENLNFDDFAG